MIMNFIHCPLCSFAIRIEDNVSKAKINEHNVCTRMQEHIKNHRIVEVLDFIDDIWAGEYNKIYEKLEG